MSIREGNCVRAYDADAFSGCRTTGSFAGRKPEVKETGTRYFAYISAYFTARLS